MRGSTVVVVNLQILNFIRSNLAKIFEVSNGGVTVDVWVRVSIDMHSCQCNYTSLRYFGVLVVNIEINGYDDTTVLLRGKQVAGGELRKKKG